MPVSRSTLTGYLLPAIPMGSPYRKGRHQSNSKLAGGKEAVIGGAPDRSSLPSFAAVFQGTQCAGGPIILSPRPWPEITIRRTGLCEVLRDVSLEQAYLKCPFARQWQCRLIIQFGCAGDHLPPRPIIRGGRRDRGLGSPRTHFPAKAHTTPMGA